MSKERAITAPAKKPRTRRQQKAVLKQIGVLRAQIQDLNDDLDLLGARACNQGKPTFSTDQVRKRLGVA